MTPEELKQKFPLAFDTIKLPVRYDKEFQLIEDSAHESLVRIYPFSNTETEHQDQIGELIAELLNSLE